MRDIKHPYKSNVIFKLTEDVKHNTVFEFVRKIFPTRLFPQKSKIVQSPQEYINYFI
jgi:hypothetical protein